MTPELYALAQRQARRFAGLEPCDRDDLVHDTFERLLVAGVVVDLGRSPAGFLYHAIHRTLLRRAQARARAEAEAAPATYADKPSRRTRWDALDGLLAANDETREPPSFSVARFEAHLAGAGLGAADRLFVDVLLATGTLLGAAKALGISKRTAGRRFERVAPVLIAARAAGALT